MTQLSNTSVSRIIDLIKRSVLKSRAPMCRRCEPYDTPNCPEHGVPLNPSSIERRVHVTSEGVRFGNCWISHASLMEGHGAIVQRGYEAWLNLPDWDLPKG